MNFYADMLLGVKFRRVAWYDKVHNLTVRFVRQSLCDLIALPTLRSCAALFLFMEQPSASPTGYTARDLAAARCLVSCFETGVPRGNPSALAVLDDGAGISYGLHQATHKSGSLAAVVATYCEMPQARHASVLDQYLATLHDRREGNVEQAAKNDNLKAALIEAAADPWMIAAQHKVFDKNYMQPALADCAKRGFPLPLTLALVYDSRIQGGWHICAGRVSETSEKVFVLKYLDARESYLKSLASKAARKSVYRPQALRALASAGNWNLVAPFAVQVGRSLVTVKETDVQAGIVGQ